MPPKTVDSFEGDHKDTGSRANCRPQKHGLHDVSTILKMGSCIALLIFSVAGTLFTEASRSADGTYPYNTFMIPFMVEASKLCASTLFLFHSKVKGDEIALTFSLPNFLLFSLPALCYFISNNCMFFIIRELGATNYQIMSTLKMIATGVLMRVFLGRKLTWLRWKALLLLALGSAVTQLQSAKSGEDESSVVGYGFVIIDAFASGAGGVISEKLLKGNQQGVVDTIHWQNMQLYFFGLVFGMGSSMSNLNYFEQGGLFVGFNPWACATVASFAAAGLLVSFILKYLDNFAKCFVAAFSIIFVAVLQQVTLESNPLQPNLIIGIVLTCVALEQYNLPQ